MDFLGFFDGLFTAFSAMRSGKSIDEPETKKYTDPEQTNVQSTTHTYDESVKSRQTQINSHRANNTLDKEQHNDRDMH
jgi:hypothetical protein